MYTKNVIWVYKVIFSKGQIGGFSLSDTKNDQAKLENYDSLKGRPEIPNRELYKIDTEIILILIGNPIFQLQEDN